VVKKILANSTRREKKIICFIFLLVIEFWSYRYLVILERCKW
jgi:hypothetical protein